MNEEEIEQEKLIIFGWITTILGIPPKGDPTKYNELTDKLQSLILKARLDELKQLKGIDAFNDAYTLDPRPAKIVDNRIKALNTKIASSDE